MAPAKPIVVGTFVVGAVALGVVAILVFGGTRFFIKTTRVMVVFPDSVAGLDVGSAVTFRGVPIGRVKDIRIQIDVQRQQQTIPVYLDLEPARITFVDHAAHAAQADLQDAVRNGLRAQLMSHGLVTGELSVNLDFHRGLPEPPPSSADGVVQIPTIPSDLQNLKDQFRQLDLPGLGEQTRKTLADLQTTLGKVSAAVGPLTEQAALTLSNTTHAVGLIESNATRTLQEIDHLARDGRGQLDATGRELDELLDSARRTTAEAETLLGNLNDMTDPHSELRGDLQASARDLAATSSDLRGFSQDLARNPVRTLMRSH